MDTSSISFTAHYTGQVWATNGLSYPAWQTPLGRLLYYSFSPFEWCGKKIVGGNVKTFLLQRHILIDHLLEQALIKHPDLQVVEIACGLSPRGARFCERYPNLTYIEADLPDMAKQKNKLLRKVNASSDRHYAVALDFFADNHLGLNQVLAQHTDSQAPIFVITEGLINYFPLSTLAPVWKQLSEILSQYPSALYVTDNYPLLDGERYIELMKKLKPLLGFVSRSDVNFHFSNIAEIEQYFSNLNFRDVQVFCPSDFYQQLPIPTNKGTPLVHVLAMKA